MSFRMQISPRSRKAARFITSVHKELQAAYMRAAHRGISQQEIADVLEVDRSVVNRRLLGSGNLTLRSIADFAYAFGEDVELTFKPRSEAETNFRIGDSTISAVPQHYGEYSSEVTLDTGEASDAKVSNEYA